MYFNWNLWKSPRNSPSFERFAVNIGWVVQIQLKLCTHRQKYKSISYKLLDKMRSLLWKSNSLSGKPWRLTMKTAFKRLNYHLVHSYRYNVVLWWKKKSQSTPNANHIACTQWSPSKRSLNACLVAYFKAPKVDER